jgi:hypothetical protein
MTDRQGKYFNGMKKRKGTEVPFALSFLYIVRVMHKYYLGSLFLDESPVPVPKREESSPGFTAPGGISAPGTVSPKGATEEVSIVLTFVESVLLLLPPPQEANATPIANTKVILIFFIKYI